MDAVRPAPQAVAALLRLWCYRRAGEYATFQMAEGLPAGTHGAGPDPRHASRYRTVRECVLRGWIDNDAPPNAPARLRITEAGMAIAACYAIEHPRYPDRLWWTAEEPTAGGKLRAAVDELHASRFVMVRWIAE